MKLINQIRSIRWRIVGLTILFTFSFFFTTLNPLTLVNAQNNNASISEARRLLNLAGDHFFNQNYPMAIQVAQQSLVIFQANHDIRGEVESLSILSTFNLLSGEISESLKKINMALKISIESKSKYLECVSKTSRATILFLTNQYSENEFQINDDLSSCSIFAKSTKNQGMQYAGLLIQLLIQLNKQNYNLALINLEELQKMSLSTSGNEKKIIESTSILISGVIYKLRGENEKAIAKFQQLVNKTDGDINFLSYTATFSIASILVESRQYNKALEYLAKISSKAFLGLLEMSKNLLLGIIYYDLNDLAKSERYFHLASTGADNLNLRNQSLQDKLKLSILDGGNTANVYKYLALVQRLRETSEEGYRQSSRTDPLVTLESGRTRIFKYLFNKKHKIAPSRAVELKELLNIAKLYKATIVEYNIIPRIGKNDRRSQDELFIHLISPNGSSGVVASTLGYPGNPPIDFTKIVSDSRKTIVNNLIATRTNRANATQFYPGQDVKLRSDPPNAPSRKIIKIDLSNNTAEVSSLSTDAPNDLNIPFNQIIYLSQSANARYSELQKLYQYLIVPIAAQLPKDPNQPVIFIPDGVLYDVPFAALQDGAGNYLIDKHPIITAPSIGVLSQTYQLHQRLVNGSKNAMIVGNPNMPPPRKVFGENQLGSLPESVTEAKSIAKILGSTPLIGTQATETTVKSRINQSQVLHFATHGILNDVIPGESAIVLASDSQNDGYLTANEIIDMSLKADLVTISACDTGRGKITSDGVVGLSRAFITAGTPSILVSLWPVNDSSNSELMTEFYRQWRSGKSKAQSLRQAMLITRQKYPNPQNWAAMTLIGEGS
jgi:CHAT domain-containing protein